MFSYQGRKVIHFVAVAHAAAECVCVVDLTSLDGGPCVDLTQWLLLQLVI